MAAVRNCQPGAVMGEVQQRVAKVLLHAAGTKRRYLVAVAALLIGCTASLALLVMLREEDKAHARQEFDHLATDHIAAIWKTVELDLWQIKSLGAFLCRLEHGGEK